MANSKEIVIKIEGENDLSASEGAQIVECDSAGKVDSLGPLAKGLKQNSTWNATVLNDTGTFIIPDILIPTYYLVRLVGTLPAIIKSDDLSRSGEVVLKKDPRTNLENIDVITSIPVKPTSTEDGTRFEYEINNDVKKSRVSVLLYAIIQRNGKIIEDKVIGTSEVKKYKKGSTDSNSLAVIATELLNQVIYDSQGFIQYKYDTYIKSNEVTKRTSEGRLPSQITKAEAEYIPKKQKELSPFSLVNTQNTVSQATAKPGAINIIEDARGSFRGDPNIFNRILNNEQFKQNSNSNNNQGLSNNNQGQSGYQETNMSNVIANNSYKTDKNGNIITYSNSQTANTSNNISNEITNSAIQTSSFLSDVSDTTIKDLQETKSNYEKALKLPNLSKKQRADIQKVLKATNKELETQITNYNNQFPNDKKYQSAGVNEAVNKATKKISAEANKTKKVESKSAGVTAAVNNAINTSSSNVSPSVTPEKKSGSNKIESGSNKKESNQPTNITPTSITTSSGQISDIENSNQLSAADITNNINDNFNKPLGSNNISSKSEETEEITAASKKSKSPNQSTVKKDIISASVLGGVLKQKPTQIEAESVRNLTAINNNIANLKQNPVNNDNGSQITNTTNNNSTNAVDLTSNKQQPMSKPVPGAKKTKEKSEPVDNSQAVLNSQLLNAIYDLLSTGIKVKHA